MQIIIDKLGWICIEKKQILLARSKNKDLFYIPGGKREEGESDKVALIREIEEELTVNLIPESFQFLGVFEGQADYKPEGIGVKITCYSADYTGQITANAEIEQTAWLSIDDKKRCSLVTQIIMEWLSQQDLL